MEEKELKAKDIPWGYPLCFNSECADKDRCMHYSEAGMGRTIECITERICSRLKNRKRF